MTKYRSVYHTILLTAVVTCTGFRDAAAAAPPAYHVTDLGTLGGTFSYGQDLNANGQVTGESAGHAFLYDGAMHDLGTLGGTESGGYGINDSGQVAGNSYPTGTHAFHAFLYDGAMHDLGTLGGTNSYGSGINASGQVAGTSSTTGDATAHAFLYDGTMHDLETLGGFNSQGEDINNSGQVTGLSNLTGDAAYHAILWTPTTSNGTSGTMHDLGTLGGTYSHGYGINDGGQVSGYSDTTGDAAYHAFLYDGTMHDLGTLGGTYSYGYGINASGQVAGWSNMMIGDFTQHAFLYTPGSGMVDLNSLINPLSGWELYQGSAINDAGQITGQGVIGGQYHAFLLTPVPEPASLALLTLALPILVWHSSRRPGTGGTRGAQGAMTVSVVRNWRRDTNLH